MKISDLITELEKIKQKYGNKDICVDYGDDGGSYSGQAEPDIYVSDFFVHFSHGDKIDN